MAKPSDVRIAAAQALRLVAAALRSSKSARGLPLAHVRVWTGPAAGRGVRASLRLIYAGAGPRRESQRPGVQDYI